MIKILNIFCLWFLVFFLLSSVCQSNENQQIKTRWQQEIQEDKAVMALYEAVKKHNLSALDDRCLAYDFDENSDINYFIVSVREINENAICKGDPLTSVNLFRFKVSRKDYSLLTDKGTKDGVFHPTE